MANKGAETPTGATTNKTPKYRLTDEPEIAKMVIPANEGDRAFQKMCKGAKFSNTTFPSGWKCPQGPYRCENGVLALVG